MTVDFPIDGLEHLHNVLCVEQLKVNVDIVSSTEGNLEQSAVALYQELARAHSLPQWWVRLMPVSTAFSW